LCDKLKGLGIEPMGALLRVPALVEQRVWSPPTKDAGTVGEAEAVLESAIGKVA
jgi:hypothetical protein